MGLRSRTQHTVLFTVIVVVVVNVVGVNVVVLVCNTATVTASGGGTTLRSVSGEALEESDGHSHHTLQRCPQSLWCSTRHYTAHSSTRFACGIHGTTEQAASTPLLLFQLCACVAGLVWTTPLTPKRVSSRRWPAVVGCAVVAADALVHPWCC